MERFLGELKRRNVLRVAAFYAAAAWLLVQIATEYRRLSRLLRGGMLSYALMRFRKRA